jgi:hypothetical protein
MTIVLALSASLFIGFSDFLGGIVSRTRRPLETSLVLFLVHDRALRHPRRALGDTAWR